MTERRCRNGHFYDKKLGDCPSCGDAPSGFNKWLRTAQLNSHLYGEIARAKRG